MGRSAGLFDVQDFLGANVIYSEGYLILPASVPAHWNAQGQPVDYMSKLGFVLIFVGLSLGMYILSLGATALAKLGRDQRNGLPVAIMIFLITIFVLFIELIAQVITTRLILH
jgi:hypothetical protein